MIWALNNFTILQLNNWTIEHTFRGSNVIQYYSRSCLSKYIRSTRIFCASILRRLLFHIESCCFLICLIQPQNIDIKGKTIAAFDLFYIGLLLISYLQGPFWSFLLVISSEMINYEKNDHHFKGGKIAISISITSSPSKVWVWTITSLWWWSTLCRSGTHLTLNGGNTVIETVRMKMLMITDHWWCSSQV